MSFTPNRIVLIGHGRYDEAEAAVAYYPGMLLERDSAGKVKPCTMIGAVRGQVLVGVEDALRGGSIYKVIPVGDQGPFRIAIPGDKYLMLLKNGQSVTRGDPLVSAGDGTLMANLGDVLAKILAPSTVISSTASETAYSNGSYTIPANTLMAGDILRIRTKAFCVAQNSTNTHRNRLYLGSSPITLADSTAIAMQANDFVTIDLNLEFRTVGASGTFIGDGNVSYTIGGTVTDNVVTIASTTLDTTAAATLVQKSLASASSSGNQIRLDRFDVTLHRQGGPLPVVLADETVNNSSGTGLAANSAAFIRCMVP